MFGKFLDPKNDVAFKRIFGTEKHKDILIHFLNDMLCFSEKEKIEEISFLKTVQDPEIASKKQSIVDVLCTDQKGGQYIVEMQVARASGFEKRAQYYAAKAYSSQMCKGGEYAKLKEVIFLAITDFTMFPEKKEYKSDHVTLDKYTYERDLKDFYFCFLELPKFEKSIDELETMIEKWTYFFKHAPETRAQDMEKIIGSDEVIRAAYQALDQFFWSPEELMTYEQETKRELDAQSILLQQQREFQQQKEEIAQKQEELRQQKEEISQQKEEISQQKEEIAQQKEEIAQQKEEISQKEEEIARQRKEILAEAKKNALLTVARQMLDQGMEVEQVVQFTNLSEREILSITDNIQV